MEQKRWFAIWMSFLLIWAVTGCAGAPKVERRPVDETIDLSGRWNDTDSRLVAREMIEDCLSRPWVERFMATHGQKIPAVIVGRVKNKTSEHINVETFVKNLERALINSGRVQFVASSQERGQIRQERVDMANNASQQTVKSPGEEYGADYMLIGTINSIRDEIKGKAVMFYQVNLELVSLENNIKAWIGEKQIKKFIKRPKTSW